METNNNKVLKDFFGENKKEIADFGFSQRVMRKLPAQADRSWIMWLFAGIGMALTILLGLYTGLIQYVFLVVQIIPQLYILIGVLSFSVIGGTAVLLGQKRRFRVI
jgi:predicted membrane-bound dolichyl-phosphate-mannose-protein mannosyltransferase